MRKMLLMTYAFIPLFYAATTASATDPVPVFEYRFPASFDGSSTDCIDQSTAGNNAVIDFASGYDAEVRPPEFTSGGSLNGTNGGHGLTTGIDLLDNSLVEQYGGFYYDVWVNPLDYGSDYPSQIINYAGTECLNLTRQTDGTYVFEFLFDNGKNTLSSDPITLGDWYHVIASFDTNGLSTNYSGTLNGTATLIINDQVVTQNSARKTAFGDSLDRPIGINRWAGPSQIATGRGHVFNPSVYLGAYPDAPSPFVDPAGTGHIVGHWKFDEAAGASTVADSSGNNPVAAVLDNVVFEQSGATSYSGTAAAFNDGSIHVAGTTDTSSDSFTFSTWVKIDRACESGEDMGIVDNRDASNASGYWVVNGYSATINQNGFLFQLGCGGSTWTELVSLAPLAVDEWTHFAVSYDAENDTARLYVDGELNAIALMDYSPNTLNDFCMGRVSIYGDDDPGSLQYPLEGGMDDAWLFDFALTDSQIAVLMSDGTVPSGIQQDWTPGDANRDNKVDAADAAILAENWLTTGGGWTSGDFNADGKVDDYDAALMAANWHSGVAASASIPEPGIWALLFSVFSALCIIRTKR